MLKEKIEIEKLDFQGIFNIACAFDETANCCQGKCEVPQGWTQQCLIPEIVNRAFACEVFLKALLVHSRISYEKKHALRELWDLLPGDLQEAAKLEILKQIELKADETIEILIDDISDTFYDWRYIYETGAKSIQHEFLCVFSGSLKEVCRTRFGRNVWDEHKEML